MEIEKKFTVKYLPENLSDYFCIHMEQGYLCTTPIVRIRKANDDYVLTYKSKMGIDEKKYGTKVSNEVELPLSAVGYEHLREKIDGRLIEKDRYLIPLTNDLKVELDVFHGYLEGLILAEVEFPSLQDIENFIPPKWFKKDVSLDVRYANFYLSKIDKWEEIPD